MISERDKMFKTDEEKPIKQGNYEVKGTDIEEVAVKMLDSLAMRIVDEDVELKDITLTPGKVRHIDKGEFRHESPMTLEVEYYED